MVCWASSFPTLRFALQEYEAGPLVLVRFFFSSAVLAVFALAVRMPLPALRDWPVLFFFGTTGMGLSSAALTYGMRTVGAGAGSFLVGMIPVFSALWARLFLGERLVALGWLGIAVSFAGVGLSGIGEGEGLSLNPGAALVVASAFLQSVFYVGQKPYLRRYSALQITCFAVWSGTLSMAWFLPQVPAAVAAAAPGRTIAVGLLGIFPNGLAFAAWSFALSRARAAHVTSAMYVMPAIALTIAFFWLGEVPSPLTVVGGVVALVGVALLNLWGAGAPAPLVPREGK